MPRKKTLEEITSYVDTMGNGEYEVIPPYVNSKTKMEFVHKTCGNHFRMRFNSFYNGSRCPKCAREHSAKIRTKSQDTFVKEVDSYYGVGEYTVIGNYIDANTPIEVKHNKCGNIYKSRPADLLRGHGCLKCSYVDRSPKIGVNQRSKLEDVQNEVTNILGKSYKILLDPDKYTGNRQRIRIKHTVCGHVFTSRFADIKQYSYGCPFCSPSSTPEGKIINILENDFGLKGNEDFYYGYVIPDLVYKNNLHFDFFFKDSSVAIEYDGGQHYIPVDFYGGINNLFANQTRDAIKTRYCVDNKIILFRIPYTITSYTELRSKLSQILKYVNK